MRLELRIRGHLLDEVELTMTQKDSHMTFQRNYEIREKYVRYMAESLRIKYQHAIENSEYEIRLIAESKVTKILEFEQYLESVN